MILYRLLTYALFKRANKWICIYKLTSDDKILSLLIKKAPCSCTFVNHSREANQRYLCVLFQKNRLCCYFFLFRTSFVRRLNRSRKTCLALQCVRVAACGHSSFHKRKFIFENGSLKSRKTSFQNAFDILLWLLLLYNYSKISLNLDATKVSRKRGKII